VGVTQYRMASSPPRSRTTARRLTPSRAGWRGEGQPPVQARPQLFDDGPGRDELPPRQPALADDFYHQVLDQREAMAKLKPKDLSSSKSWATSTT